MRHPYEEDGTDCYSKTRVWKARGTPYLSREWSGDGTKVVPTDRRPPIPLRWQEAKEHCDKRVRDDLHRAAASTNTKTARGNNRT